MPGGFEFFYSDVGLVGGWRTAKVFLLRNTTQGVSGDLANEVPGRAAISPQEGVIIDRRMDDGNPLTGYFRLQDLGNRGCDNKLDGSAGYDETITARNCTALMIMDDIVP